MAELISHRDQIANLLTTYQTKDPRLTEILRTIMDDLHSTITTVNPISETLTSVVEGDPTPPTDLSLVAVTLLPFNIQIAWGSVPNAQLYEMREGTVWEASTFIVKTPSLSAVLNPRLVGTYDMMLKAITPSGVYSVNPLHFQIIVPPFGAISLSASVIDNNVLLSWSTPSSPFAIDHYNVYRNSVQFAQVNANFLARFEAASGTYLFEVEAVDIAGNVSAKASVSATVSTPPDYILQDFRTLDLCDPGENTLVNCMCENGKVVACVDTAETFQAHFTSRSWADPEDQVTAGYERWIQDNLLTGYILNQYDYGADITNSVAVVNYVKENFSGTDDVNVAVGLSWSDDGVTWTPEVFGGAQFIASLRYLRTRLLFTAPNDDAMIAISNVTIGLSVKREVDSGSVMANPADIGGTIAYFNKAFKDVDSLTCTADSVTPITVITIFDDIPNPTFFKVIAFDAAGRPVTYLVNWKARGVV